MAHRDPTTVVVIPARNAYASVGTTLSSVLENTYEDFEIVVVDDGSTDETGAVAVEHGVHVIRIEGEGRSRARNVGAAASSAPIIIFLDADDRVASSWLEAMSAPILDGTNVLATSAGYLAIAPSGQRSMHELSQRARAGTAGFAFPLAGTFAVSRSVFEAVGGYDERLSFSENTELCMRLRREIEARGGETALVEGTHFTYHERDGEPDATAHRDRLVGAQTILDRHGEHLSPSSQFNYRSVAAIGSARVGDVRAARRYAWEAVRAQPRSLKGWSRLGAISVRPIRNRRWPRLPLHDEADA